MTDTASDTVRDDAGDPAPTRGREACGLRPEPSRSFAPTAGPARIRAILSREKRWANGTRLRYHFFDRPSDGREVRGRDGVLRFVPWAGSQAQRDTVRRAFEAWAALGIGLRFHEVTDRRDAEIRIGFMEHNGHWSYLGRAALEYGPHRRTMNFDGPLGGTEGFDVALHEIGHAIGLPHEHQNPNAGIVWDEPAVLNWFERFQGWDEPTIRRNVLDKIPRDAVSGTEWDPDSIMHYPFEKGLIRHPAPYGRDGLRPSPGLSPQDRAWAVEAYPPQSELDALPRLARYRSHPFTLPDGGQFDATFTPTETGRFRIETFGPTDVVLTLFEDAPDGPRYVAGDDDAGEDRNAYLEARLSHDRRYVVRVILLHDRDGAGGAVMVL